MSAQPLTQCLPIIQTFQLSVGAGDGNRTHDMQLGKLHGGLRQTAFAPSWAILHHRCEDYRHFGFVGLPILDFFGVQRFRTEIRVSPEHLPISMARN